MNNPVNKCLELHARNMEFFAQHYPGIHQFFNTYEMRKAKVDILPETGDVDILVDGVRYYSGKATQYAKHEVATFLSAYDYGSNVKSFAPLARNTYKNKRYFARSINNFYEKHYSKDTQFDGYVLDNLLPLVVFMGVGIGKHIDIMCKIRDIQHALVFERDMDRFAASLYAVDWRAIAGKFLEEEGRSFSFVLIPEEVTEPQLFASLWNHLLKYCPIFPATTLFYNHMGDPLHNRLSDRVNKDLYVHLFSFGNLDDELNQLNNALHNFRAEIPLFNKPAATTRLSICVVGSGPSLDARISDLKSLQEHTIIISSGTALRALWHHGITPDFHVELESDYNTYATQSVMEDREFLKAVKLIGAAQLNPLMFQLFGDARLFFKDDGALAHWFGSKVDVIANATPTCTNAALALAIHLGCDNIFLFGMDYGFPEVGAHHAKGAVYYTEKLKNTVNIKNEDLIRVPAADGGTIYTTSFLYTSKRRIDNLLFGLTNSSVYNCSDGSVLENTQWLVLGDAASRVSRGNFDKSRIVGSLFAKSNPLVSQEEITQVTDRLASDINLLVDKLMGWLAKHQPATKSDFTFYCSLVCAEFQNMESEDRGFFYFIRGTIWHFLLAGYTLVYAQKKVEDQIEVMQMWKDEFTQFLNGLSMHVEMVIGDTRYRDIDPMVTTTIGKSLTQDIDVKWEYQGYSIVDSCIEMDESIWEFQGYCFVDSKYSPYKS